MLNYSAELPGSEGKGKMNMEGEREIDEKGNISLTCGRRCAVQMEERGNGKRGDMRRHNQRDKMRRTF